MTSAGPASRRGIDVVERITLGGVTQWISIRSEDVTAPLILFLHGGPGTAQISFSRKAQRELHRSFVVVNWDQRGSGRSYSRSLRPGEMTVERFVADAEELARALLERFGQDRLVLVGHSWGSVIGAMLAARRPELVRAYVGVGQVVHMRRGEELSYRFTLAEARRRNDVRAIRDLERIGPPPYAQLRDAGVQRAWLSRYHGSTRRGGIWGLIARNLTLRDLRPLDPYRFLAGALFSLSALEDEQRDLDLLRDVPEIGVPVVFCAGRGDHTVPSELVVEYAARLRAPHCSVVWFEDSAHLPNFEEPARFAEVCRAALAPLPDSA